MSYFFKDGSETDSLGSRLGTRERRSGAAGAPVRAVAHVGGRCTAGLTEGGLVVVPHLTILVYESKKPYDPPVSGTGCG